MKQTPHLPITRMIGNFLVFLFVSSSVFLPNPVFAEAATSVIYIPVNLPGNFPVNSGSMTSASDAEGWYTYKGKEYSLTKNWGLWDAAEEEAVTVGGHLVTINDPAENDWLASTFGGLVAQGGPKRGVSAAFIGYYFSENKWQWISGEPVTYTNLFFAFPQGGRHSYLHTADHPTPRAPRTWNAAPWHTDGVWGPAYLLKGIIERPLKPQIIKVTPFPGIHLLANTDATTNKALKK